MKRLLALFIALGLAVTVCACSSGTEEKAEAPAEETTETTTEATSEETTESTAEETTEGKEIVMGALSLLNMSEEDRLAWEEGRAIAMQYLAQQGALITEADMSSLPVLSRIVYYDSLDAMTMALEAGDITHMEVPVSTAEYLCAHNDNLVVRGTYDLEGADDFTKEIAYRLGVGYSFLTTEDKADLRDELDQAITEMKEDGTLDALTQTYITDAADTDPEPVEFAQTEGETIRVAVTGSLPPMDYVAADGTPAGFNTALLAELGKRLDVNFELVQVDSVGRAAALSSGQVDLVFWTSGTDGREPVHGMTDEEHDEFIEELKASHTEEQQELMRSISGGVDYANRKDRDVPEGTIATQPYYSDLVITVLMK